MPRPARLVEHREGGFDPRFRHWTLLLYREPAVCKSAPPLAQATLDVREDPDRPGSLLVTVRGDARVTHDGGTVAHRPALPLDPAVLAAMSQEAKGSAGRRRCPSCGRGGGLKAMADGNRKCRWCALVLEERAA